MSILWTRQRRCVDEDVGEDHIDEDLGDEVSAMTSQRRVDNNVSLEDVPHGDQVSMPCRNGKGDDDCILLRKAPEDFVHRSRSVCRVLVANGKTNLREFQKFVAKLI